MKKNPIWPPIGVPKTSIPYNIVNICTRNLTFVSMHKFTVPRNAIKWPFCWQNDSESLTESRFIMGRGISIPNTKCYTPWV